jgi:aquaporin Z
MNSKDLKAVIAEFIGTFALAAVVVLTLSSQVFPVATPLMAGIVLMVMVYALGPISGSHLNPAITAGLFVARKIDLKKAVLYVIAQMLGGVVALAVANYLLVNPTVDLPLTTQWPVIISEILGTGVLAFAVGSVVFETVRSELSGVVIGFGLLVGLSMAAASNGILNPAVAYAANSFSVVYILSPLIGGIVGVALAQYLAPAAISQKTKQIKKIKKNNK